MWCGARFTLPPGLPMRYDEWASIGHAHGWLGARDTDPQTSRDATKNLAVRAGSQRAKLLAVYTPGLVLTDEQAATLAGLEGLRRCCWWKRAGELRQAGYIAVTLWPGISSTGTTVQTCQITAAGERALDAI